MNVVHVTAEMAPVAKVGGLGDVVQGLAKASAQRGNNVQVCAFVDDLTHRSACTGHICLRACCDFPLKQESIQALVLPIEFLQ